MKKLVLAVLMGGVLVLGGCSSKNKEIPSDRSKWDTELKPSIEKLNDEDKSLFTQYMMRKIMSDGEIKSGTTIGDAIQDQKNWNTEQEVKEKAQAELKAKIDAENKALKNKIDSILTSALVDKKGESSYSFSDDVTDIGITIAFQNRGTKDIAGFKGTTYFKDMFGDTIKAINLSYDDGVKAGQTATYQGSIHFNQFESEDKNLLNTSLDKIKFTFEPSTILFTDGTKLEMKNTD